MPKAKFWLSRCAHEFLARERYSFCQEIVAELMSAEFVDLYSQLQRSDEETMALRSVGFSMWS